MAAFTLKSLPYNSSDRLNVLRTTVGMVRCPESGLESASSILAATVWREESPTAMKTGRALCARLLSLQLVVALADNGGSARRKHIPWFWLSLVESGLQCAASF